MKYFLTALALLAVLLCACGPLKKNEEKNAPKAAETPEQHEETVPYILYQTGTAATESDSSEGCRLYRTAEGGWCAERFATGNGKTEAVRYAVDEETARGIFAFFDACAFETWKDLPFDPVDGGFTEVRCVKEDGTVIAAGRDRMPENGGGMLRAVFEKLLLCCTEERKLP